ncbi:sortase domain-containing protein [Nonomuraea sp. NPDC001684]
MRATDAAVRLHPRTACRAACSSRHGRGRRAAHTPGHRGDRRVRTDHPGRPGHRRSDRAASVGGDEPGRLVRLGPRPGPGRPGRPARTRGHAYRTGCFARLRELRPQTLITITHSDGTSERFLVERVEKVAKTSFPTAKVYGATRNAELRNITCGGAFDHQARSYADNVIVYASLQQTST